MSLVQDFGSGSALEDQTSHQVTVPSAVPVGSTLIISAGIAGTVLASAQDTKGNVYIPVGADRGVVHVLYSRIDTALASGDTVTVNYDANATRSAVSVLHFSETLESTGAIPSDSGRVSGNTISVGPTGAMNVGDLVIASVWLASAGRELTGTNGSTAATKYASSVATGNRAIVPAYKYVTAAGPQTVDGTLNSGAVWEAIGSGFKPYVEPEPPVEGAYGNVIVGGVKKPVESMSVIVGGVKKTVTSVSVIVGGVKKTLAE